jgi:hypothetical protein
MCQPCPFGLNSNRLSKLRWPYISPAKVGFGRDECRDDLFSMSSNADWELLMMINVCPMIVTELTGPIIKQTYELFYGALISGNSTGTNHRDLCA